MLWIDDDVDGIDASARLLEHEGYVVARARSGRSGLALALCHPYDLIVLDLRLPDMEGVDLLRQLRRQQIDTAVLVLTGFATVAAAVAVMRLGATDLREKPLIGDELVTCVRAALQTQGPRTTAAASSTPVAIVGQGDGRLPDVDADVASGLLGLLDTLAREPRPEAAADGWAQASDAKRELIAWLLRAVVRPELSVPTFVACAQALRFALRHADTRPLSELAAHARGVMQRAARYRAMPLESRMRDAVGQLGASARRARLPERDLAARLGVDASHLGRLLRSRTGLTFREWRWGAVIQHGVRQLCQTDEHIAQIAYGLGYNHPGQFDRDFRQIFGMSPSTFRGLLRAYKHPESM